MLYFFLLKLHHQISIFVWPFIVQRNWVAINSFIEYNVLNFAHSLANNFVPLIIMKKIEHEFEVIVLHELMVLYPWNIFLTESFSDFRESFDRWTVLDHYKTLFSVGFSLLLIEDQMKTIYRHQCVCNIVIH